MRRAASNPVRTSVSGRRYPLGIVQGRLSPPDPRRLQAFPRASWEEEFPRARSCGFDGIEWLFEAERFEDNPLWKEAECERIRRLGSEFVPVMSVCADYFMVYPLFRGPAADRAGSLAVLRSLIARAASVGARTILIPVLEEAELRDGGEADALVDVLRMCLPILDQHGVSLGLEMELPAKEYLALVGRCASPRIGAYYDTGNAAARGYDVAADLETLAPVLVGIHIKDRRLRGPSVPLGEGAVRFADAFSAFARIGYRGPLVLQTAFGADFMTFAQRHLSFVRGGLNSARDASAAAGGDAP